MRTQFLEAYMEHIAEYLCLLYPQVPRETIDQFVKAETERRCRIMHQNLKDALANEEDLTVLNPRKPRWPTAHVVHYADPNDESLQHSYGNMVAHEHDSLFGHINRIGSKIVAPFGSAYENASKLSSFLKGMIDEKSALRKKEKKLMLKAKERNDKTAATYHNNQQATIKIGMNSLIGAMGSNHNFLSSVANFNSVTSTGRYFVTNAFAHAERFLHGNFYFLNEEQLINHIVTCKKYGPAAAEVEKICREMNFKIPTTDEVYRFLISNLHKYMTPKGHPEIRQMVENLSIGDRIFIYYMSNMKHLVFENEAYFRPWLDSFLSDRDIDFSNQNEIDPKDLFKVDGDLAIVLSTVYNSEMPRNKQGNSISIYNVPDTNPDLARRFVIVSKHMLSKLREIEKIFMLFMCHDVAITYIHELKNMFRDVVMLSDTDSILFTTKDWVQWYQGDMKFTANAFSINAIVVYWLSKSISKMLVHISRAFGARGNDLTKMNMKNEFMMPIEIVTSLKKHYASILAIQEGVFYGDPKLDIKGVNLRGSNFCQETLNYVEWWIRSIINDIYATGSVSVCEKIADVLRFERLIYDTTRDHKQVRFLTVDPVKSKNEYRIPESSIYFNYLFWEAVFAEKYGSIIIPTKCYILPVTNLKHNTYQSFLNEKYKKIKRKMEAFFNKYNNKEVTRVPLNPLTDTIPEELIPVTDYKSIIYENMKPFYIILQSLGISVGNGTNKILLSDVYGWVSSEEAEKCKVHLSTE